MRSKEVSLRQNNRFSSDVPILNDWTDFSSPNTDFLNNICVDGLSFNSNNFFSKGTYLTIQIPIADPTFQVKSEVVWCIKNGKGYDTGVKFREVENGYRIKTVEQLRFIDRHRKKIYFEEGRVISGEQANMELMDYAGRNLH